MVLDYALHEWVSAQQVIRSDQYCNYPIRELWRIPSSAKPCILKEALGRFLLLKQILGSDGLENILFGRLLDLASDQKLIEHEGGFLKVEDYVKLAHTSKVLVQQLNITVDDLQCNQFVISGINCRAEVETGVSLVNYLHLLPLDEAAHLGLPRKDVGNQLPADLLLVVVLVGIEPLLKPQLALSAEEENKLYHGEPAASSERTTPPPSHLPACLCRLTHPASQFYSLVEVNQAIK